MNLGTIKINTAFGDIASFCWSKLEIALRVVVLPAPLAPKMATTLPFGTSRETP